MRATDSDTATESRDVRPIAAVRLTRTVAAQTIAVSVVAFFAFAYCFGRIRAVIRGESFEPIVVTATTLPDGVGWLIVSLGLVVLVVVPHELLHGIFLARYGGMPSYGVGISKFILPYAYAGTSGTSYTRTQLLVASLAPFVVLTVVGLAAMVIVPSSVLVVALAVNAAGSVGDLWMAAVLVQYPGDVYVAALPHTDVPGFAIYGSDDRVDDRVSDIVPTIVAGTVGTLVLITAVLLAFVFHALTVGTGDVVLGSDSWLLFRHEVSTDGSARIEFGVWNLSAVAIAGGLAWTLADRTRQVLA